MNTQQFKGFGVAMVTPFDDEGKVDYEGMKNLLKHQMDGGLDFLVVHGSTGEAMALNLEEKRKSLDFILEYVDGRVPIVLGMGLNDSIASAKLIASWDLRGVAAILVSNPSYVKPTQEGIYNHYKCITELTDIPIFLYNVPSRTGSNMTAETTLRLARDFDQIVGIKEASADMQQIMDILKDKPEDFMVLSGDDPMTIAMISMGAEGLISVLGNAFPKECAEQTHAALNGNFKQARNIQYGMANLIKYAFEEGNPAGIKEMLRLKGICGSEIRLPLMKVSEQLSQKIQKEMAVFNQIAT